MKNYKVFLKLLPFQGVRVASVITQGDCPGLGASALSGRVGASHQLHFLLARRLHNALLPPISFSHRLQPFLYYFHNSLEIKSFFPLNLFQKCLPANYTCCVCRKTFSEQLQFGIVCKSPIIESRLNRIIYKAKSHLSVKNCPYIGLQILCKATSR